MADTAGLPDLTTRPAPTRAWRWRVQLLGDLCLHRHDATQLSRLPGRPVALLLARLAMAPTRAHSREELVELLWPGVDAAVGRNRLRQALSALKSQLEPPEQRALGPVILADRLAVRLAPGTVACDVVEFETAVRAGQNSGAQRLYQGPLLPGFADEWVNEERLRLDALAHGLAEAAPAGHPVLPAAAGPAQAALQPVVAVPASPAALGAMRLPAYMTRLLGAEAALAALQQRVAASRLVTVHGPGGCGKTRIAVEASLRLATGSSAAAGATAAFDLVCFVSLVNATGAQGVREALAQALASAPKAEAIAEVLAGRRALLVIDNCEHVVQPLGTELADLLAGSATLHVLATSRRTLGLDGEQVFELDGLALPAPAATLEQLGANPAVALFVDRARLARADFHLHGGNAGAVAELVTWLGGLPLAIELAAARVRSLGPGQMLALLRSGDTAQALPASPGALALVARAGPRQAGDARHASMQGVLSWGWALLGAGTRQTLADLSLLPAGVSLGALQAIADCPAAEAAARLTEAVDHSMLRTSAAGDRFVMLEVVREFARGQLEPQRHAAVRARLRAWLLGFARSLPATPSLPQIREEMPNIVVALESAVSDGVPHEALELLARLRRCFEDVELPARGLDALEAAIAACDARSGSDADRGAAALGHVQIAGLLFSAGRSAAALAHAEAGLAGVRAAPRPAPGRVARALHALASVRWRTRKTAAPCLALLDEAEPLARAAEARDVLASVFALRAFIRHVNDRDTAGATALHERALALWRELGNEHAINSGLYNLAVVAVSAGDAEAALERIDEVLERGRRLADARRVRQALNTKGTALDALRRWGDAVETLRECVRQCYAELAPHDLCYALWNLPPPLLRQRRPEAALRIMAFVARYWATHVGALTARDQRDVAAVQRLARVMLAPARVRALWLQGEQASLAETVALALSDA